MIIVLKPDATPEEIEAVKQKIIDFGYQTHEIIGVERKVIGAVGGDDQGKDRLQVLESMPGVEDVIPILKPYKLAGREIHHASSVIDCGGVAVGGNTIAIMAGPCSPGLAAPRAPGRAIDASRESCQKRTRNQKSGGGWRTTTEF